MNASCHVELHTYKLRLPVIKVKTGMLDFRSIKLHEMVFWLCFYTVPLCLYITFIIFDLMLSVHLKFITNIQKLKFIQTLYIVGLRI